jgi:hypothetical protein
MPMGSEATPRILNCKFHGAAANDAEYHGIDEIGRARTGWFDAERLPAGLGEDEHLGFR